VYVEWWKIVKGDPKGTDHNPQKPCASAPILNRRMLRNEFSIKRWGICLRARADPILSEEMNLSPLGCRHRRVEFDLPKGVSLGSALKISRTILPDWITLEADATWLKYVRSEERNTILYPFTCPVKQLELVSW
jgi:hypothetical protein